MESIEEAMLKLSLYSVLHWAKPTDLEEFEDLRDYGYADTLLVSEDRTFLSITKGSVSASFEYDQRRGDYRKLTIGETH
jgi:hypothetical protein